MARIHHAFEWDADKAIANLRKHRVSFEDAAAMLADPEGDQFQLEIEDHRSDYGETRIVTYTPDPADHSAYYVIAWTARGEHDEITRIISARRANRRERRFYEQNQNI